MKKILHYSLAAFLFTFSSLSYGQNSGSEVLPNMDNNPNNTSILNDQLRETNQRLLQLEGGIDINSMTTGILNVSRGGTGQDSSNWPAGDFIYMSSTGVWGHKSTAGGIPNNVQVFNTSGTWTNPGVSQVYVKVWGDGGGGGSCTTTAQTGGGGGGGYSEGLTAVTGDIAVTVGQGGAGSIGLGGSSAGTGSSFAGSVTIAASGGGGGVDGVNGAGGAGGTGSGGQINFNGLGGNYNVAGSGGGTYEFLLTNNPGAGTSGGSPGPFTGMGGGGAHCAGGGANGGNGAAGLVIVFY